MNKLKVLVLLSLSFAACKNVQHLASVDSNGMRLDSTIVVQDEEMLELIYPFKSEVQEEMNQVIGVLEMDLTKGKPSSTLGNWFSDLVKESAELFFEENIDFAIQNYGGLRISSVSKGNVTKGKIFELMPFDNALVMVEMDKASLIQMCNHMAESGGWPTSKGMTMEIRDSTAQHILINNQALQEDKIYKVAMPDYIANGGDDCTFLTKLKQKNSGIFLRSLVIELIEEKSKQSPVLSVDTEARITKL